MPLLLGDINNLYPRIFTLDVSSPTLIKKENPRFFWFGCFFYFSQSEFREATWRSALLHFTLSVGACKDQRRHAWGWPQSKLPLRTCEDNCPFSQKATSIYIENPELNFPPIEETKDFYQAKNLKFIGTKKSTCLISLEHKVKTRLSCSLGLSPSDLIRGSLNKFPDFFCMGTFIDSTHMKL